MADNVIGDNVQIAQSAIVKDSKLNDYVRIKDYTEVVSSKISEYSAVSQFSLINKSIIGKFCSIGHGAYSGLWEHNTQVTTHPFYLYETSGQFVKGYRNYDKDTIVTSIGNDVWVGANSVILKGVTIHDGAIIGAGSVVTKDVPAYAVVAGNPAKVIKYRFKEEDITFFLKIKWWNFSR